MTAGDITSGRRVQSFGEITQPGDYFGPVDDYTSIPAIFFLKPNARDEGVQPRSRSVQHVCSPPHIFTENEDGTLTVSPSISNTTHGDVEGNTDDGWHGYLENGRWRQV